MFLVDLYDCFQESFPSRIDNKAVQEFVLDSRAIKPGDVFIAMKGEQVDGHSFVGEACDRGAVAVIAEKPVPESKVPVILRSNLGEALALAASHWRNNLSATVIGLTASNGKTTMKNMLFSIFSEIMPGKVTATKGNFNNAIGMPITLLNAKKQDRVLILEMGMNHPLEMAALTRIARPDVALIGMVSPCHMAAFDSLQGIAEAKGEIIEGVPDEGTIVLNQDDAFFDLWKNKAGERRLVSFSKQNKGDVSATVIESSNVQVFDLTFSDSTVRVTLPLMGEHNIMNALAAAASALQVKETTLQAIATGLNKAQLESGRMTLHTLSHNVLLIDDAYNASPASVKEAIKSIGHESRERILVFGEMGELGVSAEKWHREVGEFAKNNGIDHLICFGEMARYTAKAFGEGGQFCENYSSLSDVVEKLITKNQVVLVKASRFVNLTRLVDHLLSATIV
jgi:UDP-N-acetylmuramoyl-tripeptide--D-alanyl-D-alanine ligase